MIMAELNLSESEAQKLLEKYKNVRLAIKNYEIGN